MGIVHPAKTHSGPQLRNAAASGVIPGTRAERPRPIRLVLFFLGGFMLANFVVAGFTAIRPAAQEQSRELNIAQKRSHEPWAQNEPYIESARKNARKSALDALAMPLAAACSAQGHKQFIDALNFYFEQRSSQIQSYPHTWGEPGEQHIVRAWATADDNRVEKLTRETFARGYFRIEEFQGGSRSMISELVKDEPAPGPVCAG